MAPSKANKLQAKLQQCLINKIQSSPQQRITFAEYMELALYHQEYGYYNSGMVGIGAQGDFFTSSSLGRDFGELLAVQFREMWLKLGRPNPFYLVEMGAGNGDLAQDILSYIHSPKQSRNQDLECNPEDGSFAQAVNYIIIESSSALIEIQQKKLAPSNFERLSWRSWSEIIPETIVGCFFSNELVDALPVHRLIKNQNQLQEIYLEIGQYSLDDLEQQNKLVETIHPLSSDSIDQYFALVNIDFAADLYPEAYRTEVNLNALDWLKTVESKLQRGYVLTIDYGYTAQKYYRPARSQGTLQCYYQHRRHDNPYVNLGLQDITAHVDFSALQRQGELSHLPTLGFTQQGLFLMALGLGDRLNDLSSGKYGVSEIFQRRDALHQLIDPTGLGGFGVLIQGKKLTASEQSLQGLNIPI